MEVRAAIDEADVGKLKEGLAARFRVDAYPSEEFVATLFMVRSQPNVDQNVVSYDAILRVANPDGKLKPGMTASVRMVSERRDGVLRVPNAALRFKPPSELIVKAEGEGKAAGAPRGKRSRALAKVYRLRGDKLEAVRFKPGLFDDEYTEVLGDVLAEGEAIVLDGEGGALSRPAGASAPPSGPRSRGPRFY
jgi:HlyD family secretion protein